MSSQVKSEEDLLEEQLGDGIISQKKFDEEMRDLARDYQDAALEAAVRAYDDELRNW